MSRKKKGCLALFAMFVGLVVINLDLFSFHYEHPFQRTFSPETEPKNDYILTESVVLKPGAYQIAFEGSVETIGSGWYILNSQDEVILSEDFPAGKFPSPALFALSGKAQQVRIGVRYDPDSGMLDVKNIRIRGDHVLYKESLTRHALLSMVWIAFCGYVFLRLFAPSCLEKIFRTSADKLYRAEKVAFFCLGAALIASIPCLLPHKYVVGDDLYFHLYRIEGIASALKAGVFPARIYLSWMENYGVGAGFYYPDLLLYIPALLYLCGFQLLNTYHFLVVVCAFFTCLTMFLTVKRISGGAVRAAVVSAILYTLATYRLISIYYRSALGEVQAFIFYPLIVWGLYEIFHDHTERWPIFALGFGGLLSTHLISLVLGGILTVVAVLLSLPKLMREKKIWIALLYAFLSVMIVCAVFWIPMLEQSLNNDLFFQEFMTGTDTTIGPANWMPAKALFAFFDPWHFVAGSYQPYPGWSLLVVCVLFAALCFKGDKPEPWLCGAFVIACVLLWMSTAAFPWRLLVWFIKRIQVSWRLLAPASCLLALCGGIFADRFFKKVPSWGLFTGAFILALGCAIPIFIQGIEHRYAVPKARILLDQEVNAGEYMPSNLSREFIEANGDTVLTSVFTDGALSSESFAVVENTQRNGLSFSFDFSEATDDTLFSLPLVYHYGYQGELMPESGQKTFPLEILRDDLGLVAVSNGAQSAGTIFVHYEKTFLTKLAEGITLFGIAGIAFLWLRRRFVQGRMAHDGKMDQE